MPEPLEPNPRIEYPDLADKTLKDIPEERLQRLLEVARLYYQGRKRTGLQCSSCGSVFRPDMDVDKCPRCGTRFKSEIVRLRGAIPARGDLLEVDSDGKPVLRPVYARLTQEEVASRLSAPVSRSEVQRLLTEAEELGIVRFVVSSIGSSHPLSSLEERLKAACQLKSVTLVPGRDSSREEPLSQGEREAILLTATQAAAQKLQDLLTDADTLLVTWGFVVRLVIDSLRVQSLLPDLAVLPMIGVLRSIPDNYSFEASTHALAAATAFGGKGYLLPAPAIVRNRSHKDIVKQLPLVAEVLAKMERASVVLTSLAPADERATLVKQNLLNREDIWRLKQKGAIGEISGIWFDRSGAPVEDDEIQPIGMQASSLCRIAQTGVVMCVVAGDEDRLDPLCAAIRGKLINTLVTDHVTCNAILQRFSTLSDL